MKKIIISIPLSLMIILLFAAFVHAADSYEDEVGLLSKLEILTADEIEDNNMVVTRAWFIDKVSKMFNLPDASESVDEPVFTDVPQSHSQYKGIIAAYEAGLINGNGDGTFSPDSAITLQQATIILVKSLGYSDVLNVCDNLYSQVNNVSKKQGLLNGIAYLNGGGISVDTAVRLIFNTLHANVLDADGVVTGSGSNGMKYAEQDTVLKKYYDILYDEDVVQSDYYYSLTRTTAHKDEIVVGDNRYYDVSNETLVGHNVRIYYYDDLTDDVRNTVYIYKRKSSVVSFVSEDVQKAELSSITVEDENNSKRTYNLDRMMTVISNGVLLENSASFATKLCDECTYIRMIDNNSDGLYDVIYIDKYSNHRISRLSGEDETLYTYSNITIDCEEYDKVLFYGKNGKKLSFSDIAAESILSISFAGNNIADVKNTIAVWVSGNTEVITPDSISDRTLESSDGEYLKSNSMTDDTIPKFILGIEYRIYLDAFGYIAYYDKINDYDKVFGYLLAVEKKGLKSIKIKIYDESKKQSVLSIKDKVKVRKTDGGTETMSGENLLTYINTEALLRNPILYKLNDNNEVVEIWFVTDRMDMEFHSLKYLLDSITESTKKGSFRYKSANMSFMGKILYRNKTSKTLIVPMEGTGYLEEDLLFNSVVTTYFVNNQVYDCSVNGVYSFYPISLLPNSLLTDMMICQVDFDRSAVPTSINNLGVVNKIYYTTDEKLGSTITNISIIKPTGDEVIIRYVGNEDSMPIDANSIVISVGDVVNFSADSLGYSSSKMLAVYYDWDADKLNYSIAGNTYYRYDFPRLSTCDVVNREENVLLVNAANDEYGESFDEQFYSLDGNTRVFSFDKNRKELSEKNDCNMVSKGDRFVAYITGGTTISMIIYYE